MVGAALAARLAHQPSTKRLRVAVVSSESLLSYLALPPCLEPTLHVLPFAD
jgi:hypothetical protein